jgi:hypothetical protein
MDHLARHARNIQLIVEQQVIPMTTGTALCSRAVLCAKVATTYLATYLSVRLLYYVLVT